MVEKLQKTLRDSMVARWTVLVLVASMMFFAYMFVDILSPLASLLGWYLTGTDVALLLLPSLGIRASSVLMRLVNTC